MRKSLILLLLLCFLPTLVFSQGKPVLKHHGNSQQEDTVASLFDTVRRNARLHHLSRIKDRKELQQLVCTVSVTNKVPLFDSGFPLLGNTPNLQDTKSTLYKTFNPREITPELQRIALFERPRGRGHEPGYARYSVAVWPSQPEIAGKAEYWVGIELFWSAGTEFFLDHFTDEMEWKNEWKTFVVPECKVVK